MNDVMWKNYTPQWLLQFYGVMPVQCCTVPAAHMIHLGTAQQITEILRRPPVSLCGMGFFAVGTAEQLAKLEGLAKLTGISLVTSDEPLEQVYPRLTDLLAKANAWRTHLSRTEASRCTSQGMLDAAAQALGGFLVHLKSNLYMDAFAGVIDVQPRFLRSVLESRYAPLRLNEFGEAHIVYVTGEQNCDVWAYRCQKPSALSALILFFVPSGKADTAEIHLMATLLEESLDRIQAANGMHNLPLGDFKQLFAAIVNDEIRNPEQIRHYFKYLPRPVRLFCSIGILQAASLGFTDNGDSSLAAQVQLLLPDANVALYNDTIVVLLSADTRRNQPVPDIDLPALEQLLARYDAVAAFSNAISRPEMLRTNYLMTFSALQIGLTLNRNHNQRMFFFEDYVDYVVIDLCMNSFRALVGHDDLILITHPDAVKVYRYDLRHNTQLVDVLYHYCRTHGNISQASQAAFMHRNTFSSKLEKIREMVRADLSDPAVQDRMTFSCRIFQYYSSFSKINLPNRLVE